MASTPYIIFGLCLTFFTFALADECDDYTDSFGRYHSSQDCSFFQHCCGDCDNRYCCSEIRDSLHEATCSSWNPHGSSIVNITSGIAGLVIFIIIVISCCVCPCCCLYKMCRKPTPVIATTTTTVVQAPYPPQPSASNAYQYQPGYQPVPVQPGYGGQPMSTAPYHGQPFSPGYQGQVSGPPPPYQEAGAGYAPAQVPYGQAGFTAGHLPYPLQPPTQPGCPPQPEYSSTQPEYSSTQPAYNPNQPAYNPAYVEPPKTGY
ncbi:hypothetical protein SKAU_G00175830 [Synaphobranchus kaupii]|uniref:Protein shisa-5 n=1 Tax=Synaphobranchus kaupii TaxID=118154 RepID=A0A9Q1FL95_SYNKA|nr:hypothetical protein SKAU_G00175830 [Synaphobranchus kaupii]